MAMKRAERWRKSCANCLRLPELWQGVAARRPPEETRTGKGGRMLELDEVLRIAGRLEAMADEGKVRVSPMESRALALDLRTVARD